MTNCFKKTYIEISKLGVFPALIKDDETYLTTKTMDRIALIFNNSMYCEAIIKKEKYILKNPMDTKIVNKIEIPKTEQITNFKKVVKISSSWSYQFLTEKEYIEKHQERIKTNKKSYNKKIKFIIQELKYLKQTTPKFCHQEDFGLKDVKKQQSNINDSIKEITKLLK